MKTSIRRQGNSKGMTIPGSILERLGWHEGMEIELDVQGGKLVAYPLAPSLEMLLASVPPDWKPEENSWGKDIGKEAIP